MMNRRILGGRLLNTTPLDRIGFKFNEYFILINEFIRKKRFDDINR